MILTLRTSENDGLNLRTLASPLRLSRYHLCAARNDRSVSIQALSCARLSIKAGASLRGSSPFPFDGGPMQGPDLAIEATWLRIWYVAFSRAE